MPTEAAFLQTVIEHPDFDAPRLAYAEWLDKHGQPERAEFIRIQCTLAKMGLKDPRERSLRVRAGSLLEKHGQDWAGELSGLVRGWTFRRGFVESIKVEDQQFLSGAARIFSLAPIRHADFGFVWERSDRSLPHLSASPYMARLKTIDLTFGCYYIYDSGLQALAKLSPILNRMIDFSALECDISPAGLEPVVMSPDLLCLRTLALSECKLHGEPGVRALAKSPNLGQLTYLSLRKNDLGDAGAQALMASPNWGRLEGLNLSDCGLGDAAAEALAQSGRLGRLIDLDLDGNAIGDAGAKALAGSLQWSSLLHIHLSENRIGDAGALALATSPNLSRLEFVDFRGNCISDGAREQLKVRFGDHVHFD